MSISVLSSACGRAVSTAARAASSVAASVAFAVAAGFTLTASAPALAAQPASVAAPVNAAAPATLTDLAGRTIRVPVAEPQRILLGESRLLSAVALLEGQKPLARIVGWQGDLPLMDPQTTRDVVQIVASGIRGPVETIIDDAVHRHRTLRVRRASERTFDQRQCGQCGCGFDSHRFVIPFIPTASIE